ncbi:MAG: YhdP family protein [Motiliproteus sp.]
MLTPQFFYRLIRIKLGLIVALVVTIALLFSSARLLMYSLPTQKTNIEQWLSSEDYQVSIQNLKGEWHHLWPLLDARGVVLKAAGGESLFELGHLQLTLNLMQTLLQGTPVFHRVLLDRLELQLTRSRYNGWRVHGISEQASADEVRGGVQLAGVFEELMRHGEVRLVNAIVSVNLEGGQKFPPQVINAGLQNRGERVSLQARLERTGADPVDFRLLGQGLPGSDDFKARFYLKSPQLDIGFWRRYLPPEYKQLQQFSLSSELWGQWQGTLPTSVQGNLSVPVISWSNSVGMQSVQNFSARLLIEQTDDQWQLQLGSLQGRINDLPLPLNSLHASWQPQQRMLLSTDKLDIGLLNQELLSSPVVPQAVKKEFDILQPTGTLRNLEVSLDLGRPPSPQFQLRADLDRVEVASWNGAPEIRGVDGLLTIDQQGGQVDFDSTNVLLNFPDLYQQGWMLKQASGVVSWRLDDDSVWVESGLLQMAMDGIEANGRFSLDMPLAKDIASNFTLMIGMDNSNGQMAPLFVPDKVVDQGLFSWLESSIKAGKLNSGGFFYQGGLESWAPEPSIQMYFDVSDGRVKYQPQWPEISDSKSFTLVKNTEVLVQIDSGRVYDSTVTSGEVYLPPNSQRLQIKANLKGPASDGRKVLLESPTKEYLGEEFAQWQLQGKAVTALNLAIDLKNPAKSMIRVATDLSGGRYFSKDLDLDFTALQGRILYHETKGLSSGQLVGRFLDQPIQAKVSTRKDRKGSHTIIDADGRVEIARFNRWLKQPILDLWQGESSYQATLDICSLTPECTTLEVRSSLKGVQTQLVPAPYAKTAVQERPVQVRLNLAGARRWLRINYGYQYHSLMAFNDQGLRGGDIVLGAGQGDPRALTNGLQVRGALATVDPQAWQQFIDRLFPESVSPQGRPQIDPLLQSIDIRGKQVALGDQVFDDVQVKMRPATNGWEIALSAPAAKGLILLPSTGAQPFRADFDYLYLPKGDEQEPGSAQTEETKEQKIDPLLDYDPATLPPMELSVGDFRIGDDRYGQWKLQVKPDNQGIHISGIEGLVRTMNTRADIWWNKTPAGHRTRIDLDLEAPQLAEVQKSWGSVPVMESKNAHFSGQMDWRGSPLHFNVESLNGLLDIEMGAGRFIDTGNAGGALKLFGLLNFKALGRRLRLDFTDLSDKGLSFDEISAGYHIKQGVGTSTKPFKLSGPSASVELNGSFDLINETLDQKMSVALPLAENISFTALLLGTPQVAGAVFLIEKLVGKQIQKFTDARYTVTGSWHDPVMEPLRPPVREDTSESPFDH